MADKITTDKMIKVMQAFTEGKTIQAKEVNGNDWYVCNACNIAWDWPNYEYRVKPEPTYRPYHSDEEMLDDIKKRLDENCGSIQHPLISGIWLKTKNTNSKNMIIGYNATGINLYDSSKSSGSFSWYSAFYNFTYLDESPFGIKE